MLEEAKTAEPNNSLVPRTFSKRLPGRVIHSLFIVGLLALALYAAVWSMRPVWNTSILHCDTLLEAHLAVQYPDGWKFQEVKESEDVTGVLTPTAPSGLIGWWDKYVLKLDLAAWKDVYMMVRLRKPTVMKEADVDKRYSNARTVLMNALGRAYKSVTSTSIDSDGIKGFEIEAHQPIRPVAGSICTRYVIVYTKEAKTGRPIRYALITRMAEENYRSLKPTINEIIRRLRLVEYNRVSPSN